MPGIFDALVDHLVLRPEDRASLNNRGFTDDVIDRMKFRSGGENLKHDVMVCNLEPFVFDAITTNNIIIPYFDPDGSINHIRPHKFGIKGQGTRLYIPFPYLGEDFSTVVLAESEFKALASCQMGIPAIGLQGIATFSRNKFNIIPDVLKALTAKRIVICFDNENKRDPNHPKHTTDFTKIYDTPFYSYIIAVMLQKAGFEARVGILKNSWMVNGKVDIDQVLASGVPHKEYRDVIHSAVPAADLRNEWGRLPTTHRSYLERRVDNWFYTGPIKEKFHSYYKFERGDDGGELKEKKISNFTVQVLHTIFDGEAKVQRLARFVSNYGNSGAVHISPDIMVSKMAFQKFCYENGDYEFHGDDKSLQQIWHYIFLNQTGRCVIKLTGHGYNNEHDIWFFGNGAYYKDEFIAADDEGIVWIRDLGFKLPQSGEIEVPILDKEPPQFKLTDVLEQLKASVGENDAKVILGWTLGCFFMPEILATPHLQKYPFLFLYGKAQGGKSTLAGWISAFFGFEVKGYSFNSSVAGMNRAFSQMSMIPMWLEEYRNSNKDIAKINSYLRNIYDRTVTLKATKNPDEIKIYQPRSTLILSGEEYPKDAALISRCVMYHVSRRHNKSDHQASFEWLQANKSFFNYFGHYILTNKKTLWPLVKGRIDEYLRSFESEMKIADRNKEHLSIMAGICDVLLGASEDFSTFIGDVAEQQEVRVRTDQALNVFLEDVLQLVKNGRISQRIIRQNQELIYFSFGFAYGEWEIIFKGMRNEIPASRNALQDHMRKESYFLGQKNVRLDTNINSLCYEFNASDKTLPPVFFDILEAQDAFKASEYVGGSVKGLFGES